jgi:hypothetical protein
MARGFESKAVADQQESAQAPPPREDAVPDTAQLARRRRLEMSVVDVKRRLLAAHADAHRQILERALHALDDEIASLH